MEIFAMLTFMGGVGGYRYALVSHYCGGIFFYPRGELNALEFREN